jgi:cytochrome c1
MTMNLKLTLFASVLAGSFALVAAPADAQVHQVPPPAQTWSFSGPFGQYDQAQLQRGFKVYREVCSSCHSLNLVSFRNLAEPGGLGYTEKQVEQIASEYKIATLDDSGQPAERPGRPADHFPPPFPNEKAAQAANGGTAPPDMSTLAKARTYQRGFPLFVIDMFTQYQEQGPDYIVALMRGYKNPPKDFSLPAGAHYNEYFPGHAIAMPPPLSDGQVEYTDGSPQTVEQYAKDVAAFLMWASEPHMLARKRIGFQVIVFLIVLSGLLYFTKKKEWKDIHA